MICEDCGGQIEIGSWPFCPDHSRNQQQSGFDSYFDYGLGIQVTGWGDIKKAMRPHWEQDQYIQLDHRDKPASFYKEMNERREERRARKLEGRDAR